MAIKTRGGLHYTKFKRNHVERMVQLVEKYPLITLIEIKEKLESEFTLKICKNTISRHLDAQLYSLKKVHRVPDYSNSVDNKIPDC